MSLCFWVTLRMLSQTWTIKSSYFSISSAGPNMISKTSKPTSTMHSDYFENWSCLWLKRNLRSVQTTKSKIAKIVLSDIPRSQKKESETLPQTIWVCTPTRWSTLRAWLVLLMLWNVVWKQEQGLYRWNPWIDLITPHSMIRDLLIRTIWLVSLPKLKRI